MPGEKTAEKFDSPLHPAGTQPRRLRVMVIDEEPPFPPDAGKKIRTWNLLRELAKRHDIDYLCYAPEDAEPARRALEDAGIRFIPVAPRRFETGPWLYARLLANGFSPQPFSVDKHQRARFRRALRGLLRRERYDVLHCEWTPYARSALAPGVRPGDPSSRVPLLIATHNIEADILRRRGEGQRTAVGKRYFALQAARMERFERAVFAQADFVTAVSELDRRRAEEWGAKRTAVVGNGVAVDYHRPGVGFAGGSAGYPKELLFLGSLDWYPNVDAIRFFLAEIFPLLRQRDPEICLNIVGRRPDAALRRLAEETAAVTLTGEVDDVRPYLERSAVVVVPLRVGGGTRIKILEAMAAAKIVVSTSVGAEGLEVEHGVHLLLADSPGAFSDAVLRAFDPSLTSAIPAAARSCVEEKYGWGLQAAALEATWFAVAAPALDSPVPVLP